MASVVPAQPRFTTQKSLYAIDSLTSEATKLTEAIGWSAPDESSLLSILVLHHDSASAQGMIWVWAQVTPPKARAVGTMPNLVLAMPGRTSSRMRASCAQLMGDDSADTARRLASRFKRPVFVTLAGTQPSRAHSMASVAAEQMDELMAVERCLVSELSSALNK
ncbi:hypothetical protein IW147_001337 [Coemansia sp. RSA 720]|nr:hypothetical protein IW147_001337 [Coemansia sp. RSA 720]